MSGEVTQLICATAARSSPCRNPPAVPGLMFVYIGVWGFFFVVGVFFVVVVFCCFFFNNTYCQYRNNSMKETKLLNFLDFIHVCYGTKKYRFLF